MGAQRDEEPRDREGGHNRARLATSVLPVYCYRDVRCPRLESEAAWLAGEALCVFQGFLLLVHLLTVLTQ